MGMLIQDRMESDIDSVQEDWADPEKVRQALAVLSFERGEVRCFISDEMARLQVNALVKFPEGTDPDEALRLIWERAFTIAVFPYEGLSEESSPTAIVNSLIDWIDSGEGESITGLSGAESEYYQSLNPPYSCRNGPLTDVGELLQVKGVVPELYYGREDIPGISELITVYGAAVSEDRFSYSGKININTAEMPVLTALLPVENQDLAMAIYEYRLANSDGVFLHDLSSPTWYKDVPGCSDIEIDSRLIATQSDIFRIRATAELSGMRYVADVAVERQQDSKTGVWRCRILQWQ
jgi:general secretion pathway protein K